MADNMMSLIVFAVFHATYGLADFKPVTQSGKVMSKTFVPTGKVPRPSGSLLANPATAASAHNAGTVTGSRFPVHQAPLSNQFGTTLHVGETLKEQYGEQNEDNQWSGNQHLWARMQRMPKADAQGAQYGFGFGNLMGCMASVGFVVSIGVAAARKFFVHGPQPSQSIVGSQISLPVCANIRYGFWTDEIVMGVVADYCQKLGAHEAEAERAEGKFLPSIRKFVTESNAAHVGAVLKQRLGLSETELKRVVLGCPTVLSYSMEDNVLPSLTALQQRLKLSEAELKKVVLKSPTVLSYSMEDNVLPSLTALQQRLKLSETELKKVVLGMPTVLGCSMGDNVLPSLMGLQQRFELSEAGLKDVVLRSPKFLGLRMDTNLLPKLDWMQQELKLSSQALCDVIVKDPRLLSSSLKDKYRPRLKACQAVGADDMTIIKKVRLRDDQFCEFIGIPLERLHAFKEES